MSVNAFVGVCIFWPFLTRRQTERLAERRATGGADVALKHSHFLLSSALSSIHFFFPFFFLYSSIVMNMCFEFCENYVLWVKFSLVISWLKELLHATATFPNRLVSTSLKHFQMRLCKHINLYSIQIIQNSLLIWFHNSPIDSRDRKGILIWVLY